MCVTLIIFALIRKANPLPTEAVQKLKESETIEELTEKLEEYEVLSNCGICKENHRDTVIMPCMHFLYCNKCLGQLKTNACPTCRLPISGLLQCKLK